LAGIDKTAPQKGAVLHLWDGQKVEARATELIYRIRRADNRLAAGGIAPVFRDTPADTPRASSYLPD